MQSESGCYYLPTESADRLAERSFGKLTPVLTLEERAAVFRVLDCFDQPLHRSGRLLLETSGSLELLMADGRVLSQPANHNARFVADLQEGPVKQALADVSPLRSLLPIGSGNLRRAVFALLDSDEKTHCRAHLRIMTDTGGEGAVLLTLQGLRGYDRSLAALRGQIEACGGAELSCSGLYAELFPGQVAYNAKPEVIVTPSDTALDAANTIISTYIPVARANEAGIIADLDTEFLHDYRIVLRKIRSVLSLFKGVYAEHQTAALKTKFSEVMEPTGRLRDLDVYLLEKQKFYDLLPKTLHSGLDIMFKLFAEQRTAEFAKLARHLQSKSYKKEISQLGKLFTRPEKLKAGPNADMKAHDYACGLIWKRYSMVRKIAARIDAETDDTEVHALRIQCKKLRYLMEFFHTIFPRAEFKSIVKPLKELQDSLGLFNDYSVQQASLQDFLRKGSDWPNAVSLAVAQSVGALTAVLHHRQIKERAKVIDSFAQFNDPAMQETFEKLFHGREGKT